MRPAARLGLLALGAAACHRPPPPAPRTVLAPTHLAPLVDPIVDLWNATEGPALRVRYDQPDRVARQVDSGTPAAVVFTGDSSWMDRLQRGGHVAPADRLAFALDELVVVLRPGAGPPLPPGGDGRQLLQRGGGRLHVPDPRQPPGAAVALLLADLPAATVVPHDDEARILASLAADERGIVRESTAHTALAPLVPAPLRGRLDLASTIEVAVLTGEAGADLAALPDFIARDPRVQSHVLALELGMPNPRRQPVGAPPPGPSAPSGPPSPAPQPVPAR